MLASNDEGVELNAEFSVVADGGRLSLVMESAGGRGAGPNPRNYQYNSALTLLLERLRDRQAVVVSGVVASTQTARLPEEERSIVPAPIVLADERNIEQVRRQITRAQGKIGRKDGAKEGNNQKRIELRLEVPGYGPDDAARLAADLAEPASDGVLPRAKDLVRGLIGETISTPTGKGNQILKVEDDSVLVGTDRSPEGQPVPLREIQHGLDVLAARGTLEVSVAELGHRSTFVGAVLANLPHVSRATSPTTLTLDRSGAEPAADVHFGELDVKTQVKVRTEQTRLRKLLANERVSAPCALCGDEFPLEFLVAAHVKKRAACTDDERRNLRDIAMLACSFGCDVLYESGWVTVDETGCIQTVRLDQLPAGSLKLRMQHLAGRRCGAHREASEPYFAWHRTTTFLRHLAG
ncbi:hypothetical protein [Amycolatopsis circi]|uniref:hypothetical protein n=1 Tax=Amycolatopsis circi TaxID=871959 RepID=UPI000E229759|nr:hypothetical protein [Amycolatopsis circi]